MILKLILFYKLNKYKFQLFLKYYKFEFYNFFQLDLNF